MHSMRSRRQDTTSPCRPGAAAPLVAALAHPRCYPHPVRAVRLVETHISWVLLTGRYAYKIKKPLDLGFLDFSTLAARRRHCLAELRLNRRLAPELYLDVVAIRGSLRRPRIGGRGRAIEYAVRMREFPQRALASRMLARGAFTATHVDALAQRIAAFHAAAPVAPRHAKAQVLAPALQNFAQARALFRGRRERRALDALERWTRREHAALRPRLAARRARGFVRECHGDLHLGNIVVLGGRPIAFDCIEFSAALRRIDVASEVAFLFMDLMDRGRPDLAWRFLDRYLADTGDYEALALLRYYSVYRAMVRAKIHALRAHQAPRGSPERARLLAAARGYLRLAERLARRGRVALLVTHGLSGSGKTTGTQSLLERLGAIRVRSDVERKRLFGLAPLARSGSAPGRGLYTAAANEATYRRLAELAETVLEAGYPVIVDAAFLRRAERERFAALARRLRVPFVLLDFDAPERVLRRRILRRARGRADASEASLAVLELQCARREPLAPHERRAACRYPSGPAEAPDFWRALVRRLAAPRAR
jgi:aminoglycoside phosphotransferase family enzyme/predicted kinase